MELVMIPGTHNRAQQQAYKIAQMLKHVCEHKGVGVLVDRKNAATTVTVGAIDYNTHNAMVSAVKAYVYVKRWQGIVCLDTDAKWCYIR